jgi:amidase
MARSVYDLAVSTEVLLDPPFRAKLPPDGYQSFMRNSFGGLRLGVVDPVLWRFPPDLWIPSEEAKEQHVSTQSSSFM